jgi:hypothetical protein
MPDLARSKKKARKSSYKRKTAKKKFIRDQKDDLSLSKYFHAIWNRCVSLVLQKEMEGKAKFIRKRKNPVFKPFLDMNSFNEVTLYGGVVAKRITDQHKKEIENYMCKSSVQKDAVKEIAYEITSQSLKFSRAKGSFTISEVLTSPAIKGWVKEIILQIYIAYTRKERHFDGSRINIFEEKESFNVSCLNAYLKPSESLSEDEIESITKETEDENGEITKEEVTYAEYREIVPLKKNLTRTQKREINRKKYSAKKLQEQHKKELKQIESTKMKLELLEALISSGGYEDAGDL